MTDTIAAPDRAPGDIPDFDHARAEAAIRELLAARMAIGPVSHAL